MTQRPYRLAVKRVHCGLGAGVAWREHVRRTRHSDINRQMMPAELDHPWIAHGRFTQNGNVIFGSSKPRGG